VRERLAPARDAIPGLLRELVEAGGVREALVVSTCNRVEIVVSGPAGQGANEDVADVVLRVVRKRAPEVAGHLYRHEGNEAVHHLFRVAASLDSLVLGEPQILGQVKDAYDLAREIGTAGAVLHRLVPRVIRSAKRVRSETTIGTGQVSVPSVAVDLARQIFGDLSHHRAALVGTGEMGEAVAKLLRQAGSRLLVLGRNTERVREIASVIDGEPRAGRRQAHWENARHTGKTPGALGRRQAH
jgi:glutamyl-tRNA reductase